MVADYKMRAAARADVEKIAALTAAVDEAQGSESTYRRDEILIDWNRPGFDIENDTWLFETGGGEIAAFGQLAPRGDSDLVLMMWVHPDRDDDDSLARALIAPMEERGRAIAAASAYKRGVAIASEEERTLRAAIEAQGFAPDALFVEMVMAFDGAPRPAGTVPGIELRTFDPSEAEAFYEILVESFAEHWGAGFPPFDEWWRDVSALEGFDPYLSIVATEGGRGVGAMFGNMHGELGEVHDIGVLPSHRGRGIGELLMLEIFHRFRERGGNRARLWVDTGNVTSAVRLYERVGMHIARRMHFYAKPLD